RTSAAQQPVAQLQGPQEPEVFHDPLLMMVTNCIDVGDARVVFYRTCRYAPLFTDRPAFQGHFDVALVFESGPCSGSAVSVPPDEGEERENADSQHFP